MAMTAAQLHSGSPTNSQPPPTSATLLQLNLWNKVVSRRRTQLQSFTLPQLQSLQQALSPAAVDKNETEIRKSIEQRLTVNFHKSVDSNLTRENRVKGLETVRLILKHIDDLRSSSKGSAGGDAGGDAGGVGSAKRNAASETDTSHTSDLKSKRSRAVSPQAAQPQAPSTTSALPLKQPSSAATATSANSAMGMGQSTPQPKTVETSSSASAAPQTSTNQTNDDDDSDIEIIEILSPPSSPLPTTATKTTHPTQQPPPPPRRSARLTDTPIKSETSTPSFSYPPPPPAYNPPNPPTVTTRTVSFSSDSTTPTFSSSLNPRSACAISYDAGTNPLKSSLLLPNKLHQFYTRLWEWDPYWYAHYDWSTHSQSPEYNAPRFGYRTSRVTSVHQLNYGQPPTSAVSITLPPITHRQDQRKYQSMVSWGTQRPPKIYRNGEKRCIVRSLPLHRSPYEIKKRSDTHMWPKGTFVQFQNNAVHIIQRKQQSHDPTLWKGMCHVLDVTPYISTVSKEYKIDFCTREFIQENDLGSGMYGIQVAICEYIGPDRLYNLLLRKDLEEAPKQLEEKNYYNIPPLDIWSFQDSLNVALQYLNKATVVIDDSDEEDNTTTTTTPKAPASNSLTFSLLCNYSMKAIETPVRGRNCRHFQCYDLRNFLHSNSTVSGGRWRCCVCEDYVSIRDLICCGLFTRMLEEHRSSVTGSRNKVQFSADGTWELMGVSKLRYQNKRPGDGDGGGTKGEDDAPQDNTKRGRMGDKNDHEIILL
uniref:SP-RING-type domain-containing protein n=1 Tax=Ditylum brightwellii TaxID=49249 RepID=A0A7S1ZP29_9STRA|mmetsp:Transcript_35552/g.52997  ORF Transcript_35552/g.52997 Transcript_35552/m.52997 type:complete len:759 (+) Transcript_35552:196-2472(+)